MFFYSATGLAQEYYVRGEVKDSLGQPLQNVQIRQASTGLLYKTGVLGSFGFSSRVYADTLQLTYTGFRTEKISTAGATPLKITLRPLPPGQRLTENTRLSSRTANMNRDQRKVGSLGMKPMRICWRINGLVHLHFLPRGFP
jgi:hypothetical protein